MPEIEVVLDGLKLVRNGNFFKWKETFFNQISGCALGNPDTCSYCDLAMAHLLDRMVPNFEAALAIELDPFFKVYRDDGLGFTLADPAIIVDVLNFFNNYDRSIQWTIPQCNLCLMPEVLCQHYDHLEFLDCSVTWKQIRKGGFVDIKFGN